MADMNGSGNWLTNLSDAWNTITGQPVARPGQFSDQFMNSVTNSRGSMYPGPARLTPNVGNYVDPNAQGGGGMMPGQVPGIGSYSSLDWGNSPPPLSSENIPVQYPAGNAPWGTTSRNMAFNILNGLPYDRGVVGLPKKPAAPDTSFPKTAVRYKTAIGPQMGTVGSKQPGINEVSGQMRPGYQLGDGALAFATQNSKQPINGLSGLLASLFGGSGTAVGTKLDTRRGPSPGGLYNLANQAGQMNAIMAPRNGSAGGFQYQGGQKVGYAPIQFGDTSFTPSSGAQAYAIANEAAKVNAYRNATNPGNARMALGSDVGSGVASSTNPWGI